MWQDYVFAGGTIAFGLALVPTLRDRDAQVPLRTSILTGSILMIYAATQASLEFWAAAVSTVFNGAMWFAIAKWRRA